MEGCAILSLLAGVTSKTNGSFADSDQPYENYCVLAGIHIVHRVFVGFVVVHDKQNTLLLKDKAHLLLLFYFGSCVVFQVILSDLERKKNI